MRRRHFLSGAVAAIAVGCTEPEPASGPTTQIRSTTLPPPPLPTLVEVDDQGIADDPFEFGVASGDPDTTSVVLWTALGSTAIAGDVQLACDVASDPAFDALVTSVLVSAAETDGRTARIVADGLDPATTYWYRFRVGPHVSATGRTHTLPGAGAERFGIALSSCQNRAELLRWDNHITLADDPAVDLVVWLGDFIYERDASSLEEYRALYREARGDARLQASSAAHPWLVTWDDHEVVNDYDGTVDPARRLDAYRSWWEFTPTRLPRPSSDGLRVYRFVDVGDLVRIVMLDCRQYAGSETVLGSEQLEWLAGVCNHSAARTLLASPVIVSSLNVGELTPPYAFEAHPADQAAVIAALNAAPDPTVVSGDLHAQMELELAPGITELMAPPLSSSFPPDWADLLPFLPFASPSVIRAEAAHGYLRLDYATTGVTHEFVNG